MVSYNLGILFLFTFGYFTHHAIADFSIAAPNIPVNNFVLQGNGSISTGSVILSLAEQGTGSVVYWSEAQNVLDGFTTTLTYQSTSCDTIVWSGGADGFAFFIAPSINTNEDVSFGSSLGLTEKTSIALVGFIVWQGKILFKANAVGMTMGPADNVPFLQDMNMLSWRCSGPLTVRIDYSPPSTFRIRAPVTATDQTFTLDITQYFGPGKYYLGLSGATGGGYMQQEITTWDFTATPTGLVPILECFEDLGGGSYIAHFGYNNLGSVSKQFDIGPQNSFSPGDADRGQLTTFAPGRSQYYPVNAFSIPWDGQTTTWTLNDHQLTINTANINNLCPAALKVSVTFTAARNLTDAEIATIVQSIATLLQISPSRIIVIGYTYGGGAKRSINQADLATLELEIAGAGSGTSEPSASQSVQTFIQSASNTTLMNQVLNPDGSSTVGFVSSGLKETGSEANGDRVVQAPVASPIDTPSSSPIDPPNTSSPPSSSPVNSEVPSAGPSNENQPQTAAVPGSAAPSKTATPQQPADAKSIGGAMTPVYSLVIMFVLYVIV